MTTAQRYHDCSIGHKVTGHESKCAHLHGHNYRVHFHVGAPELDAVGRVMDFSIIKDKLCMWLEENWDHKFLIWEHDEIAADLRKLDPKAVILVEFNPTAENMAKYLMEVVAPQQLAHTGCVLVQVTIDETRKCSVTETIAKN